MTNNVEIKDLENQIPTIKNYNDSGRLISKLVLDTHVLIWYLEGINLTQEHIGLVDTAKQNNDLYISAISIWEIAMLSSKAKIILSIGLNEWVEKVLKIQGLNLLELSIPILMESTLLPNYEHKDPADRMIISTCRSTDAHLITFDQKIIDYANKGYLKVI